MTQPEAVASDLHPADILLNLIVTILAPMFLIASNGDVHFARMAALETVNAYRARNQVDLIVIAQIIACGLAALGSFSLSMTDDLSLSMTLRLRANGNALTRTAEAARKALQTAIPDAAASPQPEPDPAFDEATVIANVAATRERVTQNQARLQAPPAPAKPQRPPGSERELHAIWASAMTEVADEMAAAIPHLPEKERRHATIRAAALSSSANALLTGTIPTGLRPGDLASLIQPKTL